MTNISIIYSEMNKIYNEFSIYGSAVGSAQNLTKKEFKKKVQESPTQFSYGGITFYTFCEKYHPAGCWERKIIAIPSALIAGAIKTIYHLAVAIIIGIPKACFGQGKYLRNNVYRVARDFEEAFGWIVTLFNDKRGTFFVQRSLFEKNCYTIFEKKKSKAEIELNKRKQEATQEKFSLLDFQKMSAEKKQSFIAKYQLDQTLDLIGRDNFFKNLATAQEENLKEISLANLIGASADYNSSKLRIAFMTDLEFKRLSILDLEQGTLPAIEMIATRCEKLSINALPFFIQQDLSHLPKEKLAILFRKGDGSETKRFQRLSSGQESILAKLGSDFAFLKENTK